MPSINTVPNEILWLIVGYLRDLEDVAKLALASRAVHCIANKQLYNGARACNLDINVLCWAAELGRLGTVEKVLASGADARWALVDLEDWTTDGPLGSSRAQRINRIFHERCRRRKRKLSKMETDGVFDPERYAFSYMARRDESPPGEGEAGVRDVEMFEDEDETGRDGTSDGTLSGTDPLPFKLRRSLRGSPEFPTLELDNFETRPPPQTDNQPDQESRRLYPLHLAAKGGHLDIVELLLDQGCADLNQMAWGVCACEHMTLTRANGFYYRRLERGHVVDQPVTVTALHVALCSRQQEVALLLLRRGATLNFDRPGWGSHVMHTAAARGCLDVVRFLLDQEDETRAKESSQAADSTLAKEASRGKESIINVQDWTGATPLYHAYFARQRKIVHLLVEKGADVNLEFGAGLTLLHLACVDGSFAFANSLVDAGADVNRPWAKSICPYLGELRPLELCVSLHHAKSHHLYSSHCVVLHETRFERRRLELMGKLLTAGARTDGVTSPRGGPDLSAVAIAAGQHSVPMLELLLASAPAALVEPQQAASAIHQAVYPHFMRWDGCSDDECNVDASKDLDPGSPLATLRWLVDHGASVDPNSELIVEATVSACLQRKNYPWTTDVVEWFINLGVRPDASVMLRRSQHYPRRIHPMNDQSTYHDIPDPSWMPTTPFDAALLSDDFSTCELLLRVGSRPDFVAAFRDLIHSANMTAGISRWPPEMRGGPAEERRGKRSSMLGGRLRFLLKADEEGTMKQSPGAFVKLLHAYSLPPTAALLEFAPPDWDTALSVPENRPNYVPSLLFDPIYDESLERDLADIDTFYNLRDAAEQEQQQHPQQHDDSSSGGSGSWDHAFRLLLAILAHNWSAARFVIHHGRPETSWARHGPMREYFLPRLVALRDAPPPSVLGHENYQILLSLWDREEIYGRRRDCAVPDVRPKLLEVAKENNCPRDVYEIFGLRSRELGDDEDEEFHRDKRVRREHGGG